MIFQLVRLELNGAGVVMARQPMQPIFELRNRQAKVLTMDEAGRIAVNVARLPELLGARSED